MWRKLRWIIPALVVLSCSVLPLQLGTGSTEVTPDAHLIDACPTCAVCPTCPAVECPTLVGETLVPTIQPPTVTSTATWAATSTVTRVPSTVTVTATTGPSLTPTKTITVPPMPFQVQTGSPVYLRNFAHVDRGCNWMGIAGQVFDTNGSPLKNYIIIVEGFLNDQSVDVIAMSGLAPAYGPAGYEIPLASSTIASSNSIFISLYDLMGEQLTYLVPVSTYADCTKNLILINFQRRSP